MDSEFRIYDYIRQVLNELEWDTRNPQKGGEVYTQTEFRKHNSLLTDALDGEIPENIICIPWDGDFRYWIVEAKRTHKDLPKALEEAKKYAGKVNKVSSGLARFATGIAGSPDDSFFVTTSYWDGSEWEDVSINNYQTTGFLSRQQCLEILAANMPSIDHFDADPDRFLKKATEINKTLHRNNVSIKDRAHVMGALLLALADDGNMSIFDDPIKMITSINTNISSILRKHGKDDFAKTISLTLPATRKNHKGFRKAIVETLQIMREMNVRSAINSEDDALGKFYETFLKYAKGAKDMGIVLTPRHITELAVSVLDIDYKDKVFDPTCGTGGFLVAAMDHVRRTVVNNEQFQEFKENGLWGIESEDPVYGLALVNMIFRGDGKSGLQDGNCFEHQFWKREDKIFYTMPDERSPINAEKPFTRVLMNPPFAASEPARNFVDYALKQMNPDGLLFAVLPNDPILGDKINIKWRQRLLERHTVKACIKFPSRLFVPNANKGTWGLILKAWQPHENYQPVLFASLFDDDHAGNLAKTQSGIESRDNVELVREAVHKFMSGKTVTDIPREITVSTINRDDVCDFSPEAYLTEQFVCGAGVAETSHNLERAMQTMARRKTQLINTISIETQSFLIDDLMEIERGNCPPLKKLSSGEVPVVTTKEKDNGIAGYYHAPQNSIFRDRITISANGSGGRAFWHPYDFAATSDVMLGKFRDNLPKDLEFCLFVCEVITNASWRFDYYRKCSKHRLWQDVKVLLPIKHGEIDIDMIRYEVQKTPGIDMLKKLVDNQ